MQDAKPTKDNEQTQLDATPKPPKPGILGVLQSVLAAFFGVQSEQKRQQDFQSGDASSYIFVGIVMVVVFVFSIIAIVNSILDNAAKG
ncbi:DUF2970 domain-containing protein [Aliikangiella sp. IMCC44653]